MAFQMKSLLFSADSTHKGTVIPLHDREYKFEDDEPHDPMNEPLPKSLDEIELIIKRLMSDNVDIEASVAKLENQRSGNDALLDRFRSEFARRALESGVTTNMAHKTGEIE